MAFKNSLIKVQTVGEIMAQGLGIGNRAVTGEACVAANGRQAVEKISPGDILITGDIDRDFIPALEKAGATTIIPDRELITVDGQRGLVYRGSARVL